MALDPKWSEEARKNVKETNIDERMYQRSLKELERLNTERAAKETKVAAMPEVPAYRMAVSKPEPVKVEEEPQTDALPDNNLASELYDRIMVSVGKVVREEINKLVKEGRLGK